MTGLVGVKKGGDVGLEKYSAVFAGKYLAEAFLEYFYCASSLHWYSSSQYKLFLKQ